MSNTYNWRGSTGKLYEYTVHQLRYRPDAGLDGNYIFAKMVGEVWHAVYIGQGDLRERHEAALQEGCVTSKSATHYHGHLNNDAADRRSEESDLIAGNPECEAPEGCNGHD